MRFKLLLIFLFLVAVGVSSPAAQVAYEQTSIEQAAGDEPVDDAPGIAILVLITMVVMLVCVGAGIVLCALAILAIFGLIAIGVLSASVATGIYQRSVQTGIRTFIITGSIVAGGLGGMLIGWFVNLLMLSSDLKLVLPVSGIGGMLAGALFGVLAVWLIRHLTKLLNERYQSFMAKKS